MTPSLSKFHDVFHVSQLGMIVLDPFKLILLDTIEIASTLTFQPQPSRVIDYAIKSLRNKEIPM